MAGCRIHRDRQAQMPGTTSLHGAVHRRSPVDTETIDAGKYLDGPFRE